MRLILLAALVGLAGCAAGPTGPEAASRFDNFQEVATRDFRGYEQVQVLAPEAGPDVAERIGARSIGRDRTRPLSQRDVDQKLADLRLEIERALEDQVELVEEGGPGVLTVRTVLTDLDANRPTMAELADEPGLDFNSIASGNAAARVELSEDGRLLAVIEDADNVAGLNDPTLLPPTTVWQTADRFFTQFADRLAALLRG
jgi:hypothetical protein